MRICTSSWFQTLPTDYVRVGISRGAPRHQSGYRMYRALAPGAWFKSVDADTYRTRYEALLAKLDPAQVLEDLHTISADGDVALLL